LDILKFVKLADCYPNVTIAYRVLLTVPVTVASAERSFSKLKLIKTYLRSSMSQDRLNGLATLSIEKEMLKNIDVDVIINDFASQKARKKQLLTSRVKEKFFGYFVQLLYILNDGLYLYVIVLLELFSLEIGWYPYL
jgi:hypothetical protein